MTSRTDISASQLVEQGIAAFRAGDKPHAYDLFVHVLKQEPRTELAWLWLSAVVVGKAEQRYCLEQVLVINPQHTAARHGLQSFPSDMAAQPPFVMEPEPTLVAPVGLCTYPGCQTPVSRAGHSLCYQHWKTTKRGGKVAQAPSERSFRDRFPAHHRTTDGHLVRSKAEMLIDNWLYTAGIVHAYERQLPIPEEAYCDFYLPTGNVYIEYWGLERDATYRARRTIKQAFYQHYQLPLIELVDDHIRSLDDHLPKFLFPFGIKVR